VQETLVRFRLTTIRYWVYIFFTMTDVENKKHHKKKKSKKERSLAGPGIDTYPESTPSQPVSVHMPSHSATDNLEVTGKKRPFTDERTTNIVHTAKKLQQNAANPEKLKTTLTHDTGAMGSSQQPTNSTKPKTTANPKLWNFVVDYNDHFETPKCAYSDVLPVLKTTMDLSSKEAADFTVYDPYWCQGSMVKYMTELGFTNVINRNRDFYLDIKKKCIPGKCKVVA
jgi:hypothetical protein